MAQHEAHQGALDPVALIVNVTPSDVVPDLSLVTSAVIVSRTPSGVQTSWPTSITAQTETELELTHPYQVSDTATLRTYRQWASLTIAGAANPVATRAWDLVVKPR